jgi:SNF2 family DNA or RNA helicase
MITLFPHQQKALEQTKEQNKVAYYLDMGLGKTFVGSEKMKQLDGKINLVICQKSKVEDWIEHYIEHYPAWTTFDLTKKQAFETYVNSFCPKGEHLVGIISYDLIFRRPELLKVHFDTIMLDESSLIQNENSKRSRCILNKLKHDNCILLSGTPTGGKYEKLYSQCKLLGWKISKEMYWNTYVKYHYDLNNGFPLKIVDGYKNVDRLKSKLREHGAVFMKSEEVFDLPQQTYIDVKVNTTPTYRKFCRKSIVEFDGEMYVGDTVLTKMLYQRMLCGFANAEKIKAFTDLVNSTDDRLIVFYNFKNELDILVNSIEDRPVSIVNGDTKDLTAFENSENSVTFIQYQAGSMGLNLQKANKIIYFTPPLSSELFEQSKKRTHRIGQEKTCFYYKLICKKSIEEKIYKTLEMRKDFTERLFEE